MGIVIGILLFIILGISAFFFIRGFNKNKKTQTIVGAVATGIAAILFFFIPFSFHQIESGEVAVIKVWGEAKEIKTEGLSFNNWISTKYEIYDITTQEINCKINAYSQDAQSMDSSLTVQFRIMPDKAIEINKQFGTLQTLTNNLRSICEEKTKVALSESSAMTLIETRSGLSAKVEDKIKGSVEQYYINITMVAVTDITFSDAFESTVEEKMIAEQEKLKAQYEKEKAIIQAEQALEVAKLEAEAKLAQAEGEAKAMTEIAKAQANAIKLKSVEVARMLGFDIIETQIVDDNSVIIGTEYTIDFTDKTSEEISIISEYLKYLEYLEKWDGKLPQVITDSNASIFIPTPPSNN